MALDLDQLLAPISEEAPAGPDLAYDAARYEIERAFETEVSVDSSSGLASESADVDWRRVIGAIESQSGQTKDVWLAVYLCRAGALSGSLETVDTGAQFLAGLLERYWDTVHPQIEEYGFEGRKNPCESLAGFSQFVRPLERIPLLRHPRLGQFTGENFEGFRKGGESQEGYGLFRAALAETADEDLIAVAARLDSIADGLRRADQVLTAKAESGTATNFQAAYDMLGQLKRAVLAFTAAPTPAAAAEEAAPEGAATSAAPSGPRGTGRIESRDDVVQALDAIADYYRRREPASPVPLLLQRAKEWVSADFLQVLEDIAPGGLGEAKLVLQSRRPSE